MNSEYDVDDYTDEVINLIATAVGAQEDKITVTMLPFQAVEDTMAEETTTAFQEQQALLSSIQQGEITQLVIICAVILIVFIMIFIMVKRMRRGNKQIEKEEWEEGFEAVVDEEIIPDAVGEETNVIDFENKNNKTSVLEEYINKNPESVANLLRNWLNEE